MLIVLGLFPGSERFCTTHSRTGSGRRNACNVGTIAASGVRIVSREPLNRRAILIIALSLAVGLGVSQQPADFAVLPLNG
ncbi:solute carrier family 23 protein [Shigella flexneri]